MTARDKLYITKKYNYAALVEIAAFITFPKEQNITLWQC